jgi:hypothetical protein
MPGRKRALIISLFLAGLVARISMLDYLGGNDMNSYIAWGRDVLWRGLPSGFHGTYFPFQYQIFSLDVWIADLVKEPTFLVVKTTNLVFDLANLLLLWKLLLAYGMNPMTSFLYWVHPWFLTIFSNGYIDSHFTFFVLLALYALGCGLTFFRHLVAGFALGVALLMKPQVEILCFVFPVFCLAYALKHRRAHVLGDLIGPGLLLVVYTLCFYLALSPRMGLRALLVFPGCYVAVGLVMPVLTAHMPNFWYPLAAVLKQPGSPIWTVGSNIHVLPYLKASVVGALCCLALISCYVGQVIKLNVEPTNRLYLQLIAFATCVVPFLMTSAHENHLFLPSVLLILLMTIMKRPLLTAFVQATLALQALNIYLIYGFSQWALNLRPYYTDSVRVSVAVVSMLLFAGIVYELFQALHPVDELK